MRFLTLWVKVAASVNKPVSKRCRFGRERDSMGIQENAPEQVRLCGDGKGSTRKRVHLVRPRFLPLTGFALVDDPGRGDELLREWEAVVNNAPIRVHEVHNSTLSASDATRLTDVFGARAFSAFGGVGCERLRVLANFDRARYNVGATVGHLVFGRFEVGDGVALLNSVEFLASGTWPAAYKALAKGLDDGEIVFEHSMFQHDGVRLGSHDSLDRTFQAVPVDKKTLAVASLALGRGPRDFGTFRPLAQLSDLMLA
ncbi:MAG: hypothetical protein AAF411_16415 [Myxococcota bacterium]